MNPLSKLLVISLLSITISCGQSSNQTGSESKDNSKNPVSIKIKSKASYLKLNKHEIMDREGTGMVAFTCLIPEGWTVNDKLYWDYNDATLPIRYQGVFTDQKNNMLIKSYPDVRAVYSSGPTGTSGYPPPRGAIPGLKDMIKKDRGRIH